MQWSSRQTISVTLLILLALFSWVGWQTVERAVLVESASHFLLPGTFIVAMVVTLFAGSLVWQERSFRWLAASFLSIPSAFSVISLSHTAVMLVAIALTTAGLGRVQSELTERIHLSVRKSLFLGLTPLLFAVSLLVSSQYYAHVQALSWERLVPSFNLGEGVGPMFLRLAEPFYPEIRQLGDEQVTVDAFLQEVQTREQATLDDLPPNVQTIIIGSELERAKSQLSRLLGREVQGGESMQELLGEVIHRKTVVLFAGNEPHMPVPVLPFFLSLLLFLTIYPLLSFFVPLLIFLVSVLFRLARRVGWVIVKTESVEREIIVS